MDVKYFSADVALKSQQDPGYFRGYASLFDIIDGQNDQIIRGAFKASIKAFNRRHTRPRMLWQHNREEVIGAWMRIIEDDIGLAVEGRLTLEVQKSREAYELVKQGALDGLSIGFVINKSLHSKDKTRPRLITDLTLFEISLVTFPANMNARISSVS